ncbi:MAG TPA: HIT family protein [Candidatus Kaiserbacteria bacterium]|nr:HIT family protein [Candidatus Kaiserbacteria bacterium]
MARCPARGKEVHFLYMEESIFMKIIKREIPADIVYEDDTTIAFLDINPIAPGHTLAVPKKQVRNIFDVDDETLCTLMRTVRHIATPIREALGADGMNISMNNEPSAGQIVFHMHVHLIPRYQNDKLVMWPPGKATSEELRTAAQKIRARFL